MILKLYDQPKEVGFRGWIETLRGDLIAFVGINGIFQFDW